MWHSVMGKRILLQTPNAIKQRKKRDEKIALGLCTATGCKNPLSSQTYCETCLIKRRKWGREQDAKNMADGYCRHCPTKPQAPYLTVCIDCWWKSKSSNFFGTTKYMQALKDLWNNQNGKCAISGLPLIPGLNASLDHIISKSKGGTNDFYNLQWVLTSINSFKLDQTVEEMMEVCEAIIAYQKDKKDKAA